VIAVIAPTASEIAHRRASRWSVRRASLTAAIAMIAITPGAIP
jgi:hypothetical protein